jgi:poly(3-hydroxybutyrate) depolymerase
MWYHIYEAQKQASEPFRAAALAALKLRGSLNGAADSPATRRILAALEMTTRATLTHISPPFGIKSVKVENREALVTEEVALDLPFANMLHFRKDIDAPQPKVLIVAPLSGHFATLLRATAKTMLQDHDVYITDWKNARDIPLAAGRFGFEDYVDYLIKMLEHLGPGAHVVAVCQPCVQALVATSVMAANKHPCEPRSLTLMAGPIDCRISPTEVNKLAMSKPIAWFKDNLIGIVPARYPGGLREVYPGFLQLMAFMNMNMERHVNSFREFYDDLLRGDSEKANAKRRFYQEYFAVADLPAEFYLETVSQVFQEHALPQGKLKWRDRTIDPRSIRRTALLTVEGEKDDICALGQTLAAQDLCASLREYMRTHYIQAGAGHYGVFSGKRWSNNIYPVVRDVIHVSE